MARARGPGLGVGHDAFVENSGRAEVPGRADGRRDDRQEGVCPHPVAMVALVF